MGLRNWWKVIVPLALVALVAGILLRSDEGKGSSAALLELSVVGADSAADSGGPGLYPEFRPGLDRYVARCDGPTLRLAVQARAGAQVTVGDQPPLTGAGTANVSVQPGHDFRLRVDDGGLVRTYSVRCLPSGFPDWSYESLRPSGPGLFVVTFPTNRWVVAFDQDGAPRWWYRSPEAALGGQILADGTVEWSRSFGDGYGIDPRMAHEIHGLDGSLIKLVRAQGSVVDAHEHYRLADGDAYVDSYLPRKPVYLEGFGGPHVAAIVIPEIAQIDEQGNEVWHWTSNGRIALEETGRWWPIVVQIGKPFARGMRVFDTLHINTIEPWGDLIVASMRHADAVYGIDRASGNIRWKLGGTHRSESLRVVGDRYPQPFGGQHDSRIWGDHLLSVFDNSLRRARPPRGVLFDLDLDEGTATFVRQFNDPKVKEESNCCGSVRRFAGGWLIGWGDTPWVTGFNPDGKITFRMRMPGDSYRAVPVPPSISAADLDRGLERAEEP